MCARKADRNAKVDLLQAAESVFVEKGLDQSRVDDITARAGKSKGSFYLHFASKEDCFRQIVESLMARLGGCIAEDNVFVHFGGAAAKAEDVMRFWIDKDVAVFDFIWQNRALVRMMLEGGKSADYAYLIDEFARRSSALFVDWFRWGQQQGLYREDVDVTLAVQIMSGAYDRVVREMVRLPERPDLVALSRQLKAILLGGLAGPALARLLRKNPKSPSVSDRPVNNQRERPRRAG